MLLKYVSVTIIAVVAAANPLGLTVDSAAPLLASYESEVIPDSYIVVFKDNVAPRKQAFQSHFTWLANDIQAANARSPLNHEANKISHVYEDAIVGYSGRFQPEILERIRKSPDVAYVEKDSMVYASDIEHQTNAPWGLSRISHREQLTFGTYGKYDYEDKAGEGVTVYVVDTGINIDHVDLEGRARWGKTVPLNDIDKDGNGHGSHVAGTIAGKRYGVAKKASVVAVKVLGTNGSGSMSDVVKGVEFTVTEHRKELAAAKSAGKTHKGSVANMSLGGGLSRALNLAVDAAVRAGVHYAVAAGNDNRDACQYSPASSPNAITVGASSVSDDRAWFSNYGKCVDVFAPGLNIQSIWIGSKYATNTISGTSMASPHVAGLAAYLLSLADAPLTGEELKTKIRKLSTPNALTDIGAQSPNLLIFNGVSK